MAIGGFFLGGAADGFQAGQELGLKRDELTQKRDFQSQYLKIAQQSQENTEKRTVLGEIDKQVETTMTIVSEVISSGIAAGKDPALIAKAVQPLVDSAKDLAKRGGRDPAALDVRVSTWMAGPQNTDSKKTVVKIGSGLAGDTYGVLDTSTGKITPVDAATNTTPTPARPGQPNLSQSEVITPRQVQVANAPAPGQTTTAAPLSFNDRFSPATGSMAQAPEGTIAPTGGVQPRNEDFLKTLPTTPTNWPALIKGIADYDIDPAKAFRGRGEATRLMSMVKEYDPNFDMKDYASKVRTRTAFTTGPQAQNLTSLGTIMRHMATIETAGEALDNWAAEKFGVGTKAMNEVRTYVLKNKQDPRVAAFETAATAISNEAERAFRGSTTAIAGIAEWRKSMNASMSPEERKSAFGTLFELLKGRVEEMDFTYKRGMGHGRDVFEVMSPDSHALYKQFEARRASVTAPPPAKGDGWSIQTLGTR